MAMLQEMPGSVDQPPSFPLVNDYETPHIVSSQHTSPTDSLYQLPGKDVTNCPATVKSHVIADNTSSDCTFTGYMQLSSTPAHYESLERESAVNSSNASDSAQNVPLTTAQVMSGYASIAESVDQPSSVYSEITDNPSAPAVYNEINPSQMYNHIVAVPPTLISTFVSDTEESSTLSCSDHRKLLVKQLSAVVSLMALILIMAAGCVWLLLHIFLQPTNLARRVTFCALRHRPLGDAHNGVIDFDEVNINEGSAFEHSRLSAKQRSYYWLAASADLNTRELSSLRLHQQRSSTRAATEDPLLQQYGLYVLNQLFNVSISLFDMRLLDSGDTVHLISKQTVDPTSGANQPTVSFLGFSINGIFDRLVAVKYEIDNTTVLRVTVIDGESAANVSYNYGSKNKFSVTLQVPVSGVYLMTTSIHCTARHQVNILSMVNSNHSGPLLVICESLCSSMGTTLAGLTLSSGTKSFDTQLLQNDYVAASSALVDLVANNGQFVNIYVAGLPDISLVRYAVQLVLYKPVNADNTVAWSVVTALHANGDTRSLIIVTINEGGAYDRVSNIVIVPVTGVYYIMLTVQVPFNSPSRHRIMLNANTTALEVSRPRSTVFLGLDIGTTDKSIMLSLATNDVLTYHFSELFTALPCQASFSGFLLYPKQ